MNLYEFAKFVRGIEVPKVNITSEVIDAIDKEKNMVRKLVSKKVFVVSNNDFGDEGVFGSKKLAQEYIDEQDDGNNYHIEDFPLIVEKETCFK